MPIDGDYFLACMAIYVVLQRADGKVYMMRRQNTAWCNGFYNVPAGRVERGETIQYAAIRELQEEAGVVVDPADLKMFFVCNRHTGNSEDVQPDWMDFFFVANRWQGEPHIAEPHKCDHAGWYAMDDTSIEIIPNIRDAFNYIADNDLRFGLHSPTHDYLNQKVA